MAIAFRAQASGNGTVSNATAITVAKPTGTVDNDLMAMVIAGDNSNDETPDPYFDLPAGWTEDIETVETAGRGRALSVAYRVASGEGADYDITHNNSVDQEINIVILSWSGVDTTTPLDVASPAHDTTLNTTTPDPPSITPVSDNSMIVCGCMTTGAVGTAYDPPTGYTERADVDFNHTGIAVAEKLLVTAAAEDPGTFTHTDGQSTDDSIAFTIALRVAAAAGGGPKGPLGHPFNGPFGGPL